MKWLKFILSHSIFIAVCAAALSFQTYSLLQQESGYFIYGFMFFATLSSYNFYWLVSKYSFSKGMDLPLFAKKNASYLILFIIAGIGVCWCLLHLNSRYYFPVAVGVMLTVLYSVPLWPFKFVSVFKKTGILKPVLLSATWAWVTVIVPAYPLMAAWPLPVLMLLTARFFFMLMLCIIFDMRDMMIDQVHGLHSLATDVSRRSLSLIMYIVFACYIIAGFFVRIYFHEPAQEVAFVLSGIAVWVVYRLSLKPRGYFFYYFLVDGLMLFSPLATYIASI